MQTSLIVQTSFLGDIVLTTPLIAELAKRGPVDVLTTQLGATVLANNPAIRSVIKYDKRDTYGAAMQTWRTLKGIRQSPPYSAVYMAQGSFRSALIALLTGSHERVGFFTSHGKALYTRRVEYRAERHHAERLWWLSMTDCADPPLPQQLRVRLYPSDADREKVDGVLRRAGIAAGDFIALAPGSAWGTKRWPYFADLAERIGVDNRIVVVGGKSDSEAATEIARRVSSAPVLDVCGQLEILASAEIIGRARAIVTNDSAPQHLASAMGTPTLTMYGPTVPDFGFGPLAPQRATAGVSDLACRPCHRHGPARCPLGHWKCMRNLSVDEAQRLLTPLLVAPAAA
ncbi:MAG: glycosyltransferase family 9 protein [Gemmatimonadaceae bacterium]|nr:glycosyltransferase family 9 protein [Gemmatimonadaceae bacterium]